jgi:hypothetical protein
MRRWSAVSHCCNLAALVALEVGVFLDLVQDSPTLVVRVR